MITEKILQGNEMEKSLKKGIDILANTVKTTLGPKGKNVLIKTGFGEFIVTKDGVTVAREIRLKDPIEDMGAQLVKRISVRVNDLAGDGTTSAIVLAQKMYELGLLAKKEGKQSVYQIQKGMNKTLDTVIEIIKSKVKKEISKEDVFNVAYISSNGDNEIASTFEKLYEKIGKNMSILVEKGAGKTEVSYTKGMKLDNGFLSPYSVEDYSKLKTTFEKPLIFLFDGKIRSVHTLIPVLTVANKAHRPVIIIADNVELEPLKLLATQHQEGVIRSAVIKAPGYSHRKLEILSDIALMTEAKIYRENSDMKYFKAGDFGEVDKAEITLNDTVLAKKLVNKKKINERVAEIQAEIDKGTLNDYEKRKAEERIANLAGGIAVILVGAKTETEMLERKDRYEDAKSAVLVALKEGIISGGGMSYLEAYKELKDTEESPIIINALPIITEQLLVNAELSKGMISHIIKENKPTNYNIETGELFIGESMLDKGIVDPFIVVKESLKSAVSIVGTLLTSNTLVLNTDDNSGKISFN